MTLLRRRFSVSRAQRRRRVCPLSVSVVVGLLLPFLLFLFSACASHAKPSSPAYLFPPAETPAVGTVVEGVASWYGPGYHGPRASSGETYDQEQLTAAHPYWAFGTRVKVTLVSSGRSVVVRINDRFPAHKGRAIDLSRAAARQIGLIGPGTGLVRLEVVEAARVTPAR